MIKIVQCVVAGIFTNGGAKPNIIPEEAELFYLVRAPNVSELRVFQDKVSACFRAAATATGCTVSRLFFYNPRYIFQISKRSMTRSGPEWDDEFTTFWFWGKHLRNLA